MQRKTNTLLASIGLIVAYILVSGYYNTASVSAYSASITTSNSISFDVSPSGDGTSIHSESINVQSNCRAGYNLTIATPNGSDLYKYTNNTQAGTASFTAVDGTSALNSSSNTNKWGYTLTSNPTSSTVFSPLSSTESVLKTPSQTASPSADINDTFSISYGVKTDNTIAPGNYQMATVNSTVGSIVYYLTTDPSCTLYSVQYQANGADNPNGMGTTDSSTGEKSVKQINIADDTKITLLASNFKKAGYGFLGWSTDSDAYNHFTDNDNTNDPIIYGPMEDVVIDADIMATATSRNQINMYAVWVPALKDGSDNTVYFQDWDNPNTNLPHDGCSTLTQTTFDDTVTDEKGKIIVNKNSITALTDKRDNMVYTVARLADGNCWMIENLRLEHQYTKGQNQNDPTVTNQYLSQGYGGTTGTYGNFIGLAEPESANFGNANPNSIYKSDGSGDVFNSTNSTLEDIGTINNPGYRFPRYDSNNTLNLIDSTTYTQSYTNASSPSDSGTNYRTSSNIYGYGNYYTWAATIANTNYYNNTSISEVVGTSICPSNWHLPSSNSTTKEYSVLSISYGGNGSNQSGVGTGDIISNRFRTFPNNYLHPGYFNGSIVSNRGTVGCYWSRSTVNNVHSVSSYYLGLDFTALYPSENIVKERGLSVRCLIGASDVEVTLDSNNGTGAVSRVYGTAGGTVTLPSSSNPSASIAQYGYSFKNWNTAPNGSGTSYTSSYSIPAGSTGITLYAQWNPQYTITYVNNCVSWASGDNNCTATSTANTSAQKINLDSSGNGSGTLGAYNKFTMTGWKIKEWTTNADGSGIAYPVNSSYAVTGQSAGDGVRLYAHWVPIYTIQYDGNGADNPNGMGTTDFSTGVKSVKQTNVSQGDPVVLLASNFKKTGYGLAGWSTNPNATVNSGDKIYGPMETISAPAYPTSGNIITMYAVWVEAKKDGNNNPVYLQDFTTSDCNTLTKANFNSTTGEITPGSVIALTDKRDNQVYTVAKLADNNCWMTENLRLEHSGTVGNNINDSSVTNQGLSQGYGGTTGTYGNFVGLADSESANFGDSTTSNTIYKSDGSGSVFDSANNTLEDIGTTNNPGNRLPRYNSSNTRSLIDSTTYTGNYGNASSPSGSGTFLAANLYSYGNYYTWAAAMANTNHYTNYSTSEATSTSLCPFNWHLPSGYDATKEYGTLSTSYGGNGSNQSGAGTGDIMSSRFRAFPNNFLYSGYFSGSSASGRGTSGHCWSRSAVSGGSGSYDLYLLTSSLSPSSSSNKSSGFSVRCLIGS